MTVPARISTTADGLLAQFNTAGVLGVADVAVAIRLQAIVGAPVEPEVMLVAALAVRAVRAGSVCIDLDRLRDIPVDTDREVDPATLPWPSTTGLARRVAASALAAPPDGATFAPIRLAATSDGADLVYLDKYFRQEQAVRTVLAERASRTPEVDDDRLRRALDAVFGPSPGVDDQRAAARLAATRFTTVIAGGPGTGKTHTVARIIAVIEAVEPSGVRFGLCAPTGRAAAALRDHVRAQRPPGSADLDAVTLNRLLGPLPPGAGRFRHGPDHRLPHDVVIVDEASMVSLTLMHHLLAALRPTARLVLVGDPDQLASVDAGAVLADLVAGAENARHAAVVTLRRRRRFGAKIGEFADAIRAGSAADALDVISRSQGRIRLVSPDDAVLRADAAAWLTELTDAGRRGDHAAAVAALDAFRVLCAHREGPAGVTFWSRAVVDWADVAGPHGQWFPGRPVLLTETDRWAGLYNGDTGVIVAVDDQFQAAFGGGRDGTRLVHPGRLRGVTSAYAMTIHRSQGSQYRGVAVVIPPADSALLARELLYTAVTRASERVVLVGDEAGLRAGIERTVLRASGLRSTITETGR